MPDLEAAKEFILQKVDARTDAEGTPGQNASSDLWTGRRAIVALGKPDRNYPYTEDQLQAAWEELVTEGRLLNWHGLTAPTSRDHLQAIIQAELDARITRKLLIGKVNRVLNQQPAAGEVRA